MHAHTTHTHTYAYTHRHTLTNAHSQLVSRDAVLFWS